MSATRGSRLVLDASTAIAWTLADERNAYALKAAAHVEEYGALVPALWRWEVQNILLNAVRRKRATESQMSEVIDLFGHLSIEIDHPVLFGAELALARRYKLTVYDAAYLELAMRANLLIATGDRALAEAAKDADLLY